MARDIADVLEQAAQLLSQPGAWTQGAFQRGEKCFCLLGAIAFVTGDNPHCAWGNTLASDAREPLADAIGIPTFAVVDWNDAPERTQDEVVAKLREAATLARAAQVRA